MIDIIGFEGEYAISEYGEVWSYKTNRYLKPCFDKDGYKKVTLSKQGVEKQYFVHRLVATMYVKNLDNKETVDHIDGNKTNNYYLNLRWATHKEQNENINWKKKRIKIIKCIETGIYYNGITEAHKKLKLNMAHLSECCNGKRNICGGYHWRYATSEEIEKLS